ncbi:ankyrin, partial [Schizophyllum commune Tattone D]
GGTSLHVAVWSGHFGTARLLLMRGANVDALNSKHRTPLHDAAHEGYIDIIRLLVDRGAALEARDTDGWT